MMTTSEICRDDNENNSHIFSFPTEIWEKIISFIDIEDVLKLEHTCNFFKQFSESHYVWKSQCIKCLHKKNVHFTVDNVPNNVNFKNVCKRISATSFLFNTRSILDFPFDSLIAEFVSIQNMTVSMQNYIHLKLQWSGETIKKDFLNETAFYKICTDSGMTFMIMYTPFDIKKIARNVLRSHIKHSIPVIFTESTIRFIMIVPVMISPFLIGTTTYLIAQLRDSTFTFATIINGNIQEQSYRHLSLLEGNQLIVKSGTIDIWIDQIKEVLDTFTDEERADFLLNFFVNYDSRNPESILVLDIIKKKLTKIYTLHVESIQFDFTDANLKFNIECATGTLYEIIMEKRICSDKHFDPFKINVIDFKEYIFYGTDMI